VREDFGKAHDFDVRRIAVTIRLHEAENPEGIIRESDGRRVGKRTPNLTRRARRHEPGVASPRRSTDPRSSVRAFAASTKRANALRRPY